MPPWFYINKIDKREKCLMEANIKPNVTTTQYRRRRMAYVCVFTVDDEIFFLLRNSSKLLIKEKGKEIKDEKNTLISP
jgi:hypothetical protein